MIRESWEASESSSMSVVSHVLHMRERLSKMAELARENLGAAQSRQKKWYDQTARERSFQPDDKVLVLLPTTSNKLLAEWQGPYRVVRKMGKVDYLVDTHDKRQKQRIFHINMLRPWHEVPATSLLVMEVGESETDEDIAFWRDATDDKSPQLGTDLSSTQREQLRQLLEEFGEIFSDIPGLTDLVQHDIHTGSASPVRLPPYRLPQAYREPVLHELEEMLRGGIIEPSRSGWCAPIVPVKKKDGSLRLCVDYRRLNSVSTFDAYPMPRVDDLIDCLGGALYISTIDLTRGYWQVPLTKEAREKTAFATPSGLYQFTVMPFGLQGAPATFQRLMDELIRGMTSYSASYIDDLVIYSDSWDDHLAHLHAILKRIQGANLTAKVRKCQFGMRYCVYLGHRVGGGLVRPEAAKIAAIQRMAVPTTKKEVRSFLGITGYYRRFIPHYATLAAPLTDLTRKSSPNEVIWSDRCEQAFRELQRKLCEPPTLHSPDFSKPFLLQTDASERGVGAVLSQSVLKPERTTPLRTTAESSFQGSSGMLWWRRSAWL